MLLTRDLATPHTTPRQCCLPHITLALLSEDEQAPHPPAIHTHVLAITAHPPALPFRLRCWRNCLAESTRASQWMRWARRPRRWALRAPSLPACAALRVGERRVAGRVAGWLGGWVGERC